ncbi:TonB-dependent receptor [uncultured Paludibaculum sp.]|uniref:TonB-dependent receptor n=1 Tax=uncultured Paludibaculum sp. TaxID=1765020 RepID=UPI002AAC16C7|nr:TonB-dependent receptor [uncultured Paludibaculum sp.]
MLQVRVARLFIVGLLLTFCLMAQRDLGTIAGTVTDPQGGVIPNAKVTIKEEATGLVYDLTTNTSGEFLRPALKPGNYTVTAEATGFRRVAQQNVVLVGGDRVAVPISLPVGNVSESVEVSAQAPLLQTETTTLGADLGRRAVSELPLGGQRTFSFLARLSPGVVPAESGARDAVGGGFSANGVRSNGQNNFLLNGVDNNVNVIDFLNQTAFVVGPSVEAIGEMRVLTNGYNAEYGRGAGGVVNVNLKSGTNEIHGVLFEILQNDKINANRWEYNKAGKARGPFKQNQYGAAIGAPIIKNKLFIFGDYQGTRITSSGGSIQNLGYGGFYSIPTPAMRRGDFSSLLGAASAGTDANGNNIIKNQIFDPNSNATVNGQLIRTPFTGNIIPSSRFDPVAAKLMALFPDSNQPITTGAIPLNNYFVSTAGTQHTDQGDGRVDYRLSDKDSLFGSLSWQNLNKLNEPFLPGALDGTPFNAVTEEDLSRNAQLSYTRVWTPSIVSETRVGYSRLVTSRVGANPDKDLFKEFGIGGYNPMTALNGGLPQIQFANGYSQIGANDWLPSKEYSNVWDFIQNVSIMKGHHSYKFGAEYRPIKFPFFQVPYPHGEMNFNRNETAYPSASGTLGALNTLTGDDYASFLLGNINNGRISTNNFISSEKVAWAFYFQDDWKLTPKLTLNLGMRYELFSPIGEKFARQSNFVYDNLTLYIPKGKDQDAPLPPNFASAFPNVRVSRGEVDKYMIPWDKTNFAPRIGIAYNWRDNTVIRLGYGAFYGGEENQGGNPNRGESVPFNQSTDLARPTSAIFETNPFFTGGIAGGFPSNVFSLDAPVSFRGVATNFRNSLVHKWNFAVQRELPWQSSMEVAYVGNHQAHQLFQPDWNACANIGTTSSTMQGCSTVLRPTPKIGGISGTASFGFGDYHGMTAKFDKRYSNGLMMMASYTYGHALANTGTTLSGSTGFGILDPRDYSTSYSTAAWDIRHNFVSNFTYEIPFGKGKTWGTHMNKVANALVGNWQANGILSLRTGQPFTLRSNGCQGIWNSCMPDLVSGQDPQAAPSGGRNPDMWFNTAAVAAPASLTGGNLGLQSNTGPANRTLDFSLFKDFAFTERIKLQFRAEGTNVANTPQFSVPNNNRQDVSFGKVTSTGSGTERHIQFALRLQF